MLASYQIHILTQVWMIQCFQKLELSKNFDRVWCERQAIWATLIIGEGQCTKRCCSIFCLSKRPHFPCRKNNNNSPTLYSQITGKYASVESKIFPHILLLCSISYSCFNGLTINQHFIKPLQGEKCTSYLSVVDLSIVLPRVFFFAALCGRTNLRLRSRARTPTKLLRSTF